jgi:hypothetical protein
MRHLIAALVALLIAFVWFVTVAPPSASFALTAASAVAWCCWLDRHPEA